jgi:hypothetical protein
MLDVALAFLVKNMNSYLATKSAIGTVQASRIVDDQGKWVIAEDSLGASVLNIEEERILRDQLPEMEWINGRNVQSPPSLKINLSLAFVANFRQYDQALRHLSLVLTHFQSHPSFTPDEFPGLDARIERLNVELQSLTFEQLNQVWTFIGGKQLPAAFYKVRMVILRDEEPIGMHPPVLQIDSQVHGP